MEEKPERNQISRQLVNCKDCTLEFYHEGIHRRARTVEKSPEHRLYITIPHCIFGGYEEGLVSTVLDTVATAFAGNEAGYNAWMSQYCLPLLNLPTKIAVIMWDAGGKGKTTVNNLAGRSVGASTTWRVLKNEVFFEPGEMRKCGSDFGPAGIMVCRESKASTKGGFVIDDVLKNVIDGEVSCRGLYSKTNRDLSFVRKGLIWECNYPFKLAPHYATLEGSWSITRRLNVIKLKSRFVDDPADVDESHGVFLSKNLDILDQPMAGHIFFRYEMTRFLKDNTPEQMLAYLGSGPTSEDTREFMLSVLEEGGHDRNTLVDATGYFQEMDDKFIQDAKKLRDELIAERKFLVWPTDIKRRPNNSLPGNPTKKLQLFESYVKYTEYFGRFKRRSGRGRGGEYYHVVVDVSRQPGPAIEGNKEYDEQFNLQKLIEYADKKTDRRQGILDGEISRLKTQRSQGNLQEVDGIITLRRLYDYCCILDLFIGGRRWSKQKFCLQNCTREARAVCCLGRCLDLDIVNTYPEIAGQYVEKVYPAFVPNHLNKYRKKREEVLQSVVDTYGCTRGDAKMLFLYLLFGGTLAGWIKETKVPKKQGTPATDFIEEFIKDCDAVAVIANLARPDLNAIFDAAQRPRPHCTTVSYVISSIEDACISLIEEAAAIEGVITRAPVFDGVIIDMCDIHTQKNIISQAEKMISDQLGYKLKVEIKKFVHENDNETKCDFARWFTDQMHIERRNMETPGEAASVGGVEAEPELLGDEAESELLGDDAAPAQGLEELLGAGESAGLELGDFPIAGLPKTGSVSGLADEPVAAVNHPSTRYLTQLQFPAHPTARPCNQSGLQNTCLPDAIRSVVRNAAGARLKLIRPGPISVQQWNDGVLAEGYFTRRQPNPKVVLQYLDIFLPNPNVLDAMGRQLVAVFPSAAAGQFGHAVGIERVGAIPPFLYHISDNQLSRKRLLMSQECHTYLDLFNARLYTCVVIRANIPIDHHTLVPPLRRWDEDELLIGASPASGLELGNFPIAGLHLCILKSIWRGACLLSLDDVKGRIRNFPSKDGPMTYADAASSAGVGLTQVNLASMDFQVMLLLLLY